MSLFNNKTLLITSGTDCFVIVKSQQFKIFVDIDRADRNGL
jgi:hypothetical protein